MSGFEEAYELLEETTQRNVALSAVCSVLLAEISLKSAAPFEVAASIISSALQVTNISDEYLGLTGDTPAMREVSDILTSANGIIVKRLRERV